MDNHDKQGLFGNTSAYFGVVEQQGRVTLHLHMLVWIKCSLSPQQTRDKLLGDGAWREKLVSWLESCHIGEFLTGSADEVAARVAGDKGKDGYVDPTMLLPVPPPPHSEKHADPDGQCQCLDTSTWWERFRRVVDDLLFRSNTHDCKRNINKDGSKSKRAAYKTCRDNKWKKCRARFPRKVYEKTMVDPKTGALAMKKGEPWLNTFSPIMTYIFGCNTDVTCMLSGTAVKAVIIYVTDYITKPGLKTHIIFDAIRTILAK
ncbi:hypothetical protein BKA70DRAFT_1117345, partial [Coprinopsis sp. MPI-PUGE-AT-0042]